MFNSLSEGISNAIKKLKGKSLINEKDFEQFTKTLRIALLEADVSLIVVKEFIKNIKSSVIGQKIVKNFSEVETIITIIKDELVKILGDKNDELNLQKKPTIIMMVGLQGGGKTTTSAKLALYLKKQHKKNVLLSSLDVYRPAAQKQLNILAKQVAIDCLPIEEGKKPIEIAKRTMEMAENYDVVILDTAGRLHIDEELMGELEEVKKITNPAEILLIVDSMVGQESLNIAKSFNKALGVTGLILTRLDSDARGGAALSIKYITDISIKFIGNGENIIDFERFYSERIADRILGMGDITSLMEKASNEIGEDQIDSIKEKLSKGKFDFNDLLLQFKTVNKLGGITKLLKFIPGMNKIPINEIIDEKVMKHNFAIIHSMTKSERKSPEIINQSRKIRIAKGSGVKLNEVNGLMKKFQQAKTMAAKFSKIGIDNIDSNSITNLFKH